MLKLHGLPDGTFVLGVTELVLSHNHNHHHRYLIEVDDDDDDEV